ncbi:oligopeptide/dipeptide ABC transporter, permease protein [Pseudooceanicola batsensis HTCC2597]|uniref:Oligopeptide/dipeptide ABC transporter, permease protein n=1 Tax=Pseudooceanicola batsensis (strain ATCC BAA-863 / DSM 15984 / KCTC 12145 / HTCC2597) TaxID=252305 RepID=A3TWU0_PSEBH|nr:ABC transporter permease [Pseudooceanicola batsensis]EAQ03300.1 oligopeptide/dipeptide ABC transporter, permease protein [Pseudooceanicola batsensis HTCC2597]
MDPLTWTGLLGPVLNPVLLAALAVLVLAALASILLSFLPAPDPVTGGGGTLAMCRSPADWARLAVQAAMGVIIAIAAIYLVGGWVIPGVENKGIIGALSARLLPVWAALAVTFAVSITYKRRLGLYGKLFDNMIGMIGFGIVMFWIFTALFAGLFDWIVTHDPLTAVSGMKNKVPGTPLRGAGEGDYPYYLLGGDTLARDIFSRMVQGAWVVIRVAPLATLFAFMAGITLGLPAGYFGGRLDTGLSFLANLILAFPVILLFYLLVTPEMVASGIPSYMAIVLFILPILFLCVMINARFHTQPARRNTLIAAILLVLGWLYLSLINDGGTPVAFLPAQLDLFDIPGGILVVFVSVVFVNAPTVFRIVRGLTLDIQTRDYVAAAQTRGEGPWYIMLWEILPNARGPLIVDFCLRIGYTTILLGTLGFFGLGLPSDSPDWGTTINQGRKLLSIYPHPAIVPAVALLSLVLGLNLLADGLREESLKD